MKLKKLIDSNYSLINHTVSKIVDNANEVINNSVFVAIKGYKFNGIDFIEKAIKNGAKTIIYDQELTLNLSYKNINFIKVIDSKVELARLLKKFHSKYKLPKIVAVTGTNGKTSTTNYLYQILKFNNYNTLLIGTSYVYKFFNKNEKLLRTKNTTLKLTEIYKLMTEYKYDYLIMEASSQGIEEGRLLGLEFDVVCFTNITHDHLDYHKTLDNYVNSKSKIIYSLKENGILLLNYEMNYYNYLKKLSLVKTYSYSVYNEDATFFCKKISDTSYVFTSQLLKYELEFKTKLLGSFNIENLLASFSIYKLLTGLDLSFVYFIDRLKMVKGRMNLYKLNDINILIDFAHTPDGVYRVLEDINKMNYQNIITVIGCGGNKDKEKRPIIGNIVTSYSDYVIFTEDNSRTELIENIISDIVKEIKTDNYEIIYDRKNAIDKAISISKANDIILLLGKGSEEYIERDEFIVHSDIDYIENKGAIRING